MKIAVSVRHGVAEDSLRRFDYICIYVLWAMAYDRRAHTRYSFIQSPYKAHAYHLVPHTYVRKKPTAFWRTK